MEVAEGMVAIVQGSRHAGLTVTVLPEMSRALKRTYASLEGVKTTTQVSKSNVETNTERIPKHSGIPICDIRYASSYQFANCLRSPFRGRIECLFKCCQNSKSKDPILMNVPLETDTITVFLGLTLDTKLQWSTHITSLAGKLSLAAYAVRKMRQFTDIETAKLVYFAYFHSIMSYGILLWGKCAEIEKISVLQKRAIRGIYNLGPRDSLREKFKETGNYHRPQCHTDHFAQSLRRYPTASNSAQLIQRLLDYTQARNDKRSNLSKSKRTLLKKSTSQQTNRIIRRHGDEAKATTKVISTSKKPLHHSVSTITKKCSSQEELLNYTYDYLKSSSLLPRSTEVRYLTEMKRLLRDRLREIIDNKPVTCPRIHSRYILHKRKYHENILEHVPDAKLHSAHKICFYKQPIPCVCEKNTQTDKVKDEELKTFNEKEMQMILKEINEWINSIPVYPNFSQEHKIKQEETINKLAFMLKKLKNDNHFNFKAKKEIHKCLNALPMWHPPDLNDDILLREQIADNLIEKLVRMAESNFQEEISKEIKKLSFDSVSIGSSDLERVVEKFSRKLKPLAVNQSVNDNDYKEVLKTEIIKLFDELPFKFIDHKSKKIDRIAEKFAERLCDIKLSSSSKNATVLYDFGEETEKILDWYRNISEFSKLDITKYKNLLDDLATKINEHITKGLQRDDEQVKLQEEIENWLDIVAVKVNGCLDTNTKKQLSNKLIQKFFTLANSVVNNEVIGDDEPNDENYFSHILGWFEDISQLSDENKNENRKAVQKLARQLEEIQTQEKNFEKCQINMQEAILNWLQNMFKYNNQSIDSMTQENLVNQLVFKLNNLKQKKLQQNKELYNDVITWLNENARIKSDLYFDQNIIDNLISTFTEIEGNSDEKIIEAQTKDALTNFTKTLSVKTGLSFPLKQQELLEQKLFKRMNIKPQQRKRWNREINQSFETEQLQLGKELATSTPKTYACDRFPSTLSNASPIRNESFIDQSLSDNKEYIQYFTDIKGAIDGWINQLDLNIPHTEQSDLVRDIATDVIDRHKYLQLSENKSSKDNELEHLKYQIFRLFKNLDNHEALSEIISKVNDLNELVLNIKVPKLIKIAHKQHRFEDFNSPKIQDLVNSLKAWFNNKISSDVQNLYFTINYDDLILTFAKRLANLKENSNSDINLKNDISQWFSKLFPQLDRRLVNSWTESLNNHLIDYLANDKQTEVTGSHYRKMLSDTISQILPSLKNISADDFYHLEHLKEKITDAFINLHYFTEDRNMLDKFKKKLIREVNQFCNEYLKHYPETPLNTEELNRNLYNALKQVSVPNIESIRSDLEQVRLKEEITDWLQKVPLKKSEDIEMQLNQMVSSLAKCLHDIEKDKINLETSDNKNSEMETLITNWLKNIPLKEDEILNLPGFANKLIEKLNATSKCRMLSISKIGKYDDSVTLFQIESTAKLYPRSTLTVEDRSHLNKIRKRLSYSSGENLTPNSIDISISPLPKDNVMHTEISKIEETIQTSVTSLIEKSSLINREISPQVIIREFYWDSNGSNQSLQLNIPTSPQKITAPSTGVTAEQNTQTKAFTSTKEVDAQTIDIIQNLNNINQAVKTNPKISPQIKKGVDAQTDHILDRQGTNSTRSLVEGEMIPYAVRPPGILSETPPTYYPEDNRAIHQRISPRPEVFGARRNRGEICCTCGERMLSKCRARPHSGCGQYCNTKMLKYCSNCYSRCPYPSFLFFRKEF